MSPCCALKYQDWISLCTFKPWKLIKTVCGWTEIIVYIFLITNYKYIDIRSEKFSIFLDKNESETGAITSQTLALSNEY